MGRVEDSAWGGNLHRNNAGARWYSKEGEELRLEGYQVSMQSWGVLGEAYTYPQPPIPQPGPQLIHYCVNELLRALGEGRLGFKISFRHILPSFFREA